MGKYIHLSHSVLALATAYPTYSILKTYSRVPNALFLEQNSTSSIYFWKVGRICSRGGFATLLLSFETHLKMTVPLSTSSHMSDGLSFIFSFPRSNNFFAFSTFVTFTNLIFSTNFSSFGLDTAIEGELRSPLRKAILSTGSTVYSAKILKFCSLQNPLEKSKKIINQFPFFWVIPNGRAITIRPWTAKFALQISWHPACITKLLLFLVSYSFYPCFIHSV